MAIGSLTQRVGNLLTHGGSGLRNRQIGSASQDRTAVNELEDAVVVYEERRKLKQIDIPEFPSPLGSI